MSPRFAVTAFKTVFDVAVDSVSVDLDTLCGALTRFEHKPKLRRKDKDEAKKALRLWSPAWYSGDRRGSEGVAQLSCLVLDFDGGLQPQQASELFGEHLHVLHSTWSHRPERPKFRVCLPLAHPVPAADWSRVWEWGQERVGGRADPAPKSPGSTFALPAVVDAEHPRLGWLQEGPLLDPVALGLCSAAPPPPLRVPEREHPFHRAGLPGRRYEIEHARRPAPDWDVDAAFEELF